MEIITQFLDVFLHLDAHLDQALATYGLWLYGILFVIVFCETGLVVTPILPGDSLLFAVGALAARENSPLQIGVCMALLFVAAVLGDAVNYAIGLRMGPKVFAKEQSLLWNKKHLLKAQAFYEKYGGKTIVLARFVPIVRTFAPFVAGIGRMGYARFAVFNVTGALAWISGFCLLGYWFGNFAVVKRNFQYVILAIVFISILPAIFEYLKERRSRRQAVVI